MIGDSLHPVVLSLPLCGLGGFNLLLREDRVVLPLAGCRQVRAFARRSSGGFIASASAVSGRWGFIDAQGGWLCAAEFEDTRSFGDDGLARVKRAGRWGYADLDGRLVVEPRFEEARPFHHGLAAVCSDGVWRFIDRHGDFALSSELAYAGDFSACGLALAARSRQERLLGYIDRAGNWAIAPQFRAALEFGPDAVAPASTDGSQHGLIDRSGHWVLKPGHGRINAFNADGLAHYREADWNRGSGYLDSRGVVVIAPRMGMSEHMSHGLVAIDGAGTAYVGRDGQPLDAPLLSWSQGFNRFGFCLARSADSKWNPVLQRHEPLRARWGHLLPDGRFMPAPEQAIEPLTDAEGWVQGGYGEAAYSHFMDAQGNILLLDVAARLALRVCLAEQVVEVQTAAGELLWQGRLDAGAELPRPFFQRPLHNWLNRIDSLEAALVAAADLLGETEARLHAYAAGASGEVPLSTIEDRPGQADAGNDEDGDADPDDDTDDPRVRAERRLCLSRRLLGTYVSEAHNGSYPFLATLHNDTAKLAGERLLALLSARFGETDPDPEPADTLLHGALLGAWATDLGTRVAGDCSPWKEARQLWLSLLRVDDSGDGDEWHQIWLLCAPSKDALAAARQARSAHDESLSPRSESVLAAIDSRPPVPEVQRAWPDSREAWLAVALDEPAALAHMPTEMLDAAMADAVLDAKPEALEYLPPGWHTPARLEALVRHSAKSAAAIPPACMNTEMLALARSLYADHADWQWRDERNSRRPERWDKNCLDSVWGALLSEQDCLHAVQAGEALKEVPHWLRTPQVQAAALRRDIANIRHIDPAEITPALAARAVRHDYLQLIESIPARLIDVELCLASVRANGTSLRYVPMGLHSVEVCANALEEDYGAFIHVPDALREAVCDRLIESAARMGAEPDVDARPPHYRHSLRAWARLWNGNFAAAIDDARLALGGLRYPVHAHYVMACAHAKLGQIREAAAEASTVLSLCDPYTAEFNPAEPTAWLRALARDPLAELDSATVVEHLRQHPRNLADVPRQHIDDAMVDAALAADASAIAFVPKRLFTPERYVLALRESCKSFHQIPADMLSEAACIEHVRDAGYHLRDVPDAWRTLAVCAQALEHRESALEHVPEAMREAALAAAQELRIAEPKKESPARTAPRRSWFDRKLFEYALPRAGSRDGKQRGLQKTAWALLVAKAAFGARSAAPTRLTGLTGWLVQRPFAALVINGGLALLALICHLFVAVHAWQDSGILVGVATFFLMGLAELFWIWQFAVADPPQWGMLLLSIAVPGYLYVYRPVHLRVAQALAKA